MSIRATRRRDMPVTDVLVIGGVGAPGHIRIPLTVERDTVVCALSRVERASRGARPDGASSAM